MDGLKIVGWLDLYVHDSAGRLLEEHLGRNIITAGGKTHLANLISGQAGAQQISKMSLGDGGAGVSPLPTVAQLFSPIPFVEVDAALRHSLGLTSQIDSVVVDGGLKTMTYTAFFNSANAATGAFLSGIPNVANECALLSNNDVVVALRSFKAIPFDQPSAIGIRAVWTLQIG